MEGRIAEYTPMFIDFREEGRQTRARMDERFGALDQKIDQAVAAIRRDMSIDFRWLVGILAAALISVVGALIAVSLAR